MSDDLNIATNISLIESLRKIIPNIPNNATAPTLRMRIGTLPAIALTMNCELGVGDEEPKFQKYRLALWDAK